MLQLQRFGPRLRTEAVKVRRLAAAWCPHMATVLHFQIAIVMASVGYAADPAAAGVCRDVLHLCGPLHLGVGCDLAPHTAARAVEVERACYRVLGSVVAASDLVVGHIGGVPRSVVEDSAVAVAAALAERMEVVGMTGLPVEARRTAVDPEALGLSRVRYVEADVQLVAGVNIP